MTQGIGNGSFVDMNGDEAWSDNDVTERTEALYVRSQFSVRDELILNRVQWGIVSGKWTPTADEVAGLQALQTLASEGHAAGIAARADLVLRGQAQAVEAAQARLLQPLNPDDANDATDRAAAQATVAAATPDVMAVVTFRNRYPAPQP